MTAQIIRMLITGTFLENSLMTLPSTLIFVCFLPTTIQFVITYRYGAGKGRIMFSSSVAVLCGGLYGLYQEFIPMLSLLPVISLGISALIFYGISRILSIKIYEKKDL